MLPEMYWSSQASLPETEMFELRNRSLRDRTESRVQFLSQQRKFIRGHL